MRTEWRRVADRCSRSRGGGGRWKACEAGLTLLEVMIVIAILMVLAAAAMPVAKVGIKRQKELELRRALRDIRTAIDEYHKYAAQGLIQQRDVDAEGYPPDLDTLVEGIEQVGTLKKLKFLRRIPVDPMTGEAEWGMRSYQDDWDSKNWGRQNVYDVYTPSKGTALDGTKYEDW